MSGCGEDDVLDRRELNAPAGAEETQALQGGGSRACGLADRLYAQLSHRIGLGSLKGGQRLPSEGRLSEEFGVSRPVVREAISRLHADGLVTTRRGSGTFVLSQPVPRPVRLGPIATVPDIAAAFELRIAVEAETAMLAARRREESVLSLLETLNDACGQGGEDGIGGDVRFHLEIARASQNRWLEEVMKTLLPHLVAGIGMVPAAAKWLGRQARGAVQREHEAIAEAIRSGDEELARLAMRRHLESARLRILDGSVER